MVSCRTGDVLCSVKAVRTILLTFWMKACFAAVHRHRSTCDNFSIIFAVQFWHRGEGIVFWWCSMWWFPMWPELNFVTKRWSPVGSRLSAFPNDVQSTESGSLIGKVWWVLQYLRAIGRISAVYNCLELMLASFCPWSLIAHFSYQSWTVLCSRLDRLHDRRNLFALESTSLFRLAHQSNVRPASRWCPSTHLHRTVIAVGRAWSLFRISWK